MAGSEERLTGSLTRLLRDSAVYRPRRMIYPARISVSHTKRFTFWLSAYASPNMLSSAPRPLSLQQHSCLCGVSSQEPRSPQVEGDSWEGVHVVLRVLVRLR